MTDFTASNGIILSPHPNGRIKIIYRDSSGREGDETWAGADDGVALREFFQHERDEELCRWRWPERPEFVVYPEGDAVRVLRESSGTNWYPVPRPINPVGTAADIQYQAAAAYFDAHPVKKPWHDAKPGEVWIVTVDGTDRALLVDPRQFTDGNLGYDFTDSGITAARRIYPEASA